ncbi:MBL fold metallo-hydrolase [Rhodococcus koreensis]
MPPHFGVRWLGHASALFADCGTVVLTDPVLTDRIAHLRRRRGPSPIGPHVRNPDAVLLSHLHADHPLRHAVADRPRRRASPVVLRSGCRVRPSRRAGGGRRSRAASGRRSRLAAKRDAQ